MKRRPTVELKSIIESERLADRVTPVPPPPAGATLREWFAGLALSNPALMNGIDQDARATEAVRIADELVKALAFQRAPSQESMAAPTEEALAAWSEQIQERALRGRQTLPEMRRVKSPHSKTLAGLAAPTIREIRRSSESFTRATGILRSETIPPPPPTARPRRSAGRYTIIDPEKS